MAATPKLGFHSPTQKECKYKIHQNIHTSILFALFIPYCYRVRPLNGDSNQVWQFPKDKDIYDVDWIGIISRKKRVNCRIFSFIVLYLSIFIYLLQSLYGRLLVDSTTKLLVPKPQSLQPLKGRNGLTSANLLVRDSRTILVPQFTFKALAPGGLYSILVHYPYIVVVLTVAAFAVVCCGISLATVAVIVQYIQYYLKNVPIFYIISYFQTPTFGLEWATSLTPPGSQPPPTANLTLLLEGTTTRAW